MDSLPLSPLDLLRRRRRPAPRDWLLAEAGRAIGGRTAAGLRVAVIACCRAELDWANADGRARAAELGIADRDVPGRVPPPWEAARLPHEAAAARLLNVWGHLDPMEWRIRALIRRLRAQRAAARGPAAAPADWSRRAAGTLDDLRWYRRERRRLWAAWLAAADGYRAARDALR